MQISFEVNDLFIDASFYDEDIEHIFKPLIGRWTALWQRLNRRVIVFLAAPPGAGKTTLSLLLQYLSEQIDGAGHIQAVSADGFHYPNSYLETHTFIESGVKTSLRSRKGAWFTFDVDALRTELADLHKEAEYAPTTSEAQGNTLSGQLPITSTPQGDTLSGQQPITSEDSNTPASKRWPIYSRASHDVVPNSLEIWGDIVLIEGNYLLLDEGPWSDLASFADETVFLRANEELLYRRLVNRKIQGGATLEEAEAWYIQNDQPNVCTVLGSHRQADVELKLSTGGHFSICSSEF